MKLCRICDNKVEGTWCKSCHRFVKTYEVSNTMYLNERHDVLNDKGCTYHTDVSDTTVRRSPATVTQRTHTPASGTGASRSASKKKGKVTVLVVIIVYIIVNCVGVMGLTVEGVFDKFSRGFLDDVSRDEYDEYDEYDEEESDIFQEEQQAHLDRENRNGMLMELEPLLVAEEEGYTIRYFDSADVEDIGYSCDDRHFDMDLEGFEKWLLSNTVNGFQFSDSSSRFSNYYYIGDDGEYASFTCYRDYDGFGDFSIRADFDTASKQLHILRLNTNGDSMDMGMCVSLAEALEPDTEWSKDQFSELLEEAKETGDYTTLYYSNEVHIAFEKNKEGYTLIYYPVR